MPPPRPRDIFSAAFLNDTQRLHFLATEGVPGGYEDDEDGELEEEEEAAIDADEELVRLKQLYIPTGDEEDEEDNRDEVDDDNYSQEAEEERENKVEQFRKLIRRKLRRRAIALKVNVSGLIKTGLTPVDMHSYGVMFRSVQTINEKCSIADNMFTANAPGSHPLTVHWKPSKRSQFPAYPVHWAVMGRSHESLRFLVLNGANTDVMAGESSPLFPKGLTAAQVAESNGLYDTLEVLRTAVEEHTKKVQREEEEKQLIESQLEQIKAIKERRKMEREQRAADRRAEEEEEAAAAAAAEEGEEEGLDEEGED